MAEQKAGSARLDDLDLLVRQLTCANPKPELLKEQMQRCGLEFSDDPAECMSRVLFLIQKIQFDFAHDLPEFSTTSDFKLKSKKVRKDGIEI